MNFDFQIFKLINNLANKNIFLDWLGIFAAKYLIFIIVVVVISLAVFKKDKIYRLIAINALASAGLAWLINYIIGLIYFRPRPFVNHEVFKLIQKSALEKSFPSDHAAIAFAIAFSVYFYNKKLGIIFLILALIVGIGRIFVGVHYPLDVLGGILIGFLVALLVKRLNKK